MNIDHEGLEEPEITPWSFYFTRAAVVYLIYFTSFIIPNINVMLILGGSVLGTIVTIIIPILFYNRAYSGDLKHLSLDKSDEERQDIRKSTKVINYIVLIVGVTIGSFGFVKAVQEVINGEIQLDG